MDLHETSSNKPSTYYGAVSFKLGLHRLDLENKKHLDLSSVGQGFSFMLGRKVLPILSTEVALNFWSHNEDQEEDQVEHELFHDFHFSGTSVGVNAILHLPGVQGPYGKVGRHCWAATAYDVLDFWSGAGCSNLFGGGLYFGEQGKGRYLELSHIRYESVDSWFLSLGFRY